MGLDSCEDRRPTAVAGVSEIVGLWRSVPGKRRELLPPDLVFPQHLEGNKSILAAFLLCSFLKEFLGQVETKATNQKTFNLETLNKLLMSAVSSFLPSIK